MGGQKEARQGLEAERALIDYFNRDKEGLRKCLSEIDVIPPSSFTVVKPERRVKCDLMLRGDFTVCISLKAVKDASFHQLDRRWLDEWRGVLNMPQEVYNAIWEGIMRKARDPRAVFIDPKHWKVVGEFFRANLPKILREIFTRDEEDLKVLAVWDRRGNELCLFNMDEVISFLSSQPVQFSDDGIIKIGEFVSIQRKGGDGSHVKKPKTDPTHPGNQLQFKFKPLEFMRSAKGLLKSCCVAPAKT